MPAILVTSIDDGAESSFVQSSSLNASGALRSRKGRLGKPASWLAGNDVESGIVTALSCDSEDVLISTRGPSVGFLMIDVGAPSRTARFYAATG